MSMLIILTLAFIQNIAFTMTSRSRNRDHMIWHATCSVLSNGIWFITMRELIVADLNMQLIMPYIIGTVSGSLLGAKVSMRIEKLLNSTT